MYFLNFITCALRLASSYEPIFPFPLDDGAPACLSVCVVCDAVNAREMNGARQREFFFLEKKCIESLFRAIFSLLRLHTRVVVIRSKYYAVKSLQIFGLDKVTIAFP